MLSIGIIGLPNVGKSTLFNALTRSKQANVQNYPFTTIDPNIGVVEVPDERLERIVKVSQSKKIIPTAIQFVDIAGLVKGASEGAGLGNQFLSHIREVDAIAQVVRSFNDPNVAHVHNKIDPKEDVEVVNLELILADMQTVKKRLANAKKNAKAVVAKEAKFQIETLEKIFKQLETGKPARDLECNDEEKIILKDLHLLTMKPMIYVLNTDEKNSNNKLQVTSYKLQENIPQIMISAKLEAELADLSQEEAKQYLKELKIEQTGLDKLIVAGYQLLNLITFFTFNETETRAWTIKRGTKTPDAAGVIHTDFIKGFIKADVCDWQDFVECNGWTGVKEKGKMRIEGKEYVVRNGDLIYFHVST